VFVHNDIGIYAGGGGATIQNNFIGTKDGSTAAGNATGIYVGGSGGWIYNNVISGNSGVGVDVFGDYGGVTIELNAIGLNAARTAKLANGGGGILLRDGSDQLISDNLISGNSVAGIIIQNSSSVTFENNTIGLNSGGGVVANTRGIDASCGGGFTIEDNTIAGNQFDGLTMSGISGSSFERNTIADNKGSGLRIDLGTCYGGNNFVNDNLVTGNSIDGVLVTGGSVQNEMTANQIFANGRKNINLNSSTTPLPNDVGDSDGGSNFQQNYPVLDSVTQSGSQTDVFFTLNTGDGDYIVEFFAVNPFPKSCSIKAMVCCTSARATFKLGLPKNVVRSPPGANGAAGLKRIDDGATALRP
jgi:parallel beta-helix repeat protein